MKKVLIGEPVIVAQSTTEPIFKGGYQDPFIHCSDDGVLYVRFNARRDCYETFGEEDKNPVYRSSDRGKTWQKMENDDEWVTSLPSLPNGDKLLFKEHPVIYDFPELPPIPSYRHESKYICGYRSVYKIDELSPFLGEKVAKEYSACRVLRGNSKVDETICKVNWDNMPVMFYPDNKFLFRSFPTCAYRVDKNNTMWMPTQAPYIKSDGTLGSDYCCTHLMRSDDFGKTWDYVSTVVYDEKYNAPDAIDVEGFSETALEITDDGSMIMIIRTGSLFPFNEKGGEYPTPKLYLVKSKDMGKTWEKPVEFYPYGVRPVSVKLGCGTIIMSSGRPGVYIRTCDDPAGEIWNDMIPILPVPKEDFYERYIEYSCANNGICAYDDNTAFLVYSDFTLNAPNGERAKSIVVREIKIIDK